MKLILLLIFTAVGAWAQCGALTLNPLTGLLDCTGPSASASTPTVYNVLGYGIVAGGVDTAGANSTALLALLATVNTAGGGDIYFPCSANPTTYRFDSQVLFPNDGTSPQPSQSNIRLIGPAGGGAWYGTNCAVLDLRYVSGNQNAKIETRGLGTLTIQNLTIKDGGASNVTPMFHSTNTTSLIYDSTFIMSGNVAQDAIVLGGTSTTLSTGVNSPFQGYYAKILRNHFRAGNRALYARTYANAVNFEQNSFQAMVGTIAVECDGSVGGPSTGLRAFNNTIEMTTYVYGFKLTACRQGDYVGNSFYDNTGTVTSLFNLNTLSTANNIVIGVNDGDKTILTDDDSGLSSALTTKNGGLRAPGIGGYGNVSANIPGLSVSGQWDNSVLTTGYPGQLNVYDYASPDSRISIGAVNTGTFAIDAYKIGTSAQTLQLNPSGGAVQFANVAGGTTTVAGGLLYDTTAKNFHAGANSVDNIVPLVVTSAPLVDTNYVKASVSGGVMRLVDGGSSAGNPSHYNTSTTFTGIGPTAFTPSHTLDIYDATASTGVTQLFISSGANQGSNKLLNIQFPGSVNNILDFGNDTGRLSITTNSGGLKWYMLADNTGSGGAPILAMSSDGVHQWNSGTNLGAGSIDTMMSRASAGLLSVDTTTIGNAAGGLTMALLTVSGASITLSGLGSATGTPDSACFNSNTLKRNAALTCTVSNETVKNHFEPLRASSDDFMRLLPAQFEYNDVPGRLRWGFGAMQVAGVNHALGDGYRDDGQAWSLDQNAILALTVKVVQEQKLEIDALKMELKRLTQ